MLRGPFLLRDGVPDVDGTEPGLPRDSTAGRPTRASRHRAPDGRHVRVDPTVPLTGGQLRQLFVRADGARAPLRWGVGAPKAKLGVLNTLTLTVPGLPAGTTAVAITVTVTNPTASSYLSVYPGGIGRPGASNLNFVAGQTIPNLVLVPLGPGNTVTFYNNAGTVNVLGDLVGYFKPGVGAGFTGQSPTRVLNTLAGVGAPKAKLGAGRTLSLTVPGLPAGTTAVAINVTVTNPTASSYLSVYPGGTGRPGASNLNFVAGQTIPNLVLVPLGPGNTVTFYNKAGTINVLTDLVGYYR
jgi:hypothetical protein